MDECVGRAPGRRPVAYLICNQVPPVEGKPSLMTFAEVNTLFHEFGHGLQHMLTDVERPLAAGIRNIEWDAVELPSQFMENWCYHRETLLGLTGHFETGARLPEETFRKIEASRTFRAGSDALRQLYFALTDLALHHDYDPDGGASPFDVQHRIAAKTTTIPPLPEDRFLCGFTHIFGGGYAAGYYSYSGPRCCPRTRSAPSRRRASTIRTRSRAPGAASATRCWRSVAAVTPWRSSKRSAAARRRRKPCCATAAFCRTPPDGLRTACAREPKASER